jgi:hypothetical protein
VEFLPAATSGYYCLPHSAIGMTNEIMQATSLFWFVGLDSTTKIIINYFFNDSNCPFYLVVSTAQLE